jgi:hypothetical protein
LELSRTVPQRSGYMKRPAWIATAVAVIAVVAVLVWRGIVSLGNPDPLAVQTSRSAAVFDIAVLVLREGLECILVLAAITAGLIGEQQRYRRPVAAGAGVGLVATLATWGVAVRSRSGRRVQVTNAHSRLARRRRSPERTQQGPFCGPSTGVARSGESRATRYLAFVCRVSPFTEPKGKAQKRTPGARHIQGPSRSG